MVIAQGGSGGSGDRARLRAEMRGLHALHDAVEEVESDLVGPAALLDDNAVVRADLDLVASDGDDESSAARTAASGSAAAPTATHCVILTKRAGSRKAPRLGVQFAPALLELMGDSAQLVNHVVHVAARGAAAAQGVRIGDVLVDVNGVPLYDGKLSAASVAKAVEHSAYPQTVRFHRPSLTEAALMRGSGDGVGARVAAGAADASAGASARPATLSQRFPRTWRRRRLAAAHGSALRFPTAALLRCGGGRVALALSAPLAEGESRRALAGAPTAAEGGRLFNRSAAASSVARRCARRLNVVPAAARAERGGVDDDDSASHSPPLRAWFPGASLLARGAAAEGDGGIACADEQFVYGGSGVLPRVERGAHDWTPALVIPADDRVRPYAIEVAADSERRDIARALRLAAPSAANREEGAGAVSTGAHATRLEMPRSTAHWRVFVASALQAPRRPSGQSAPNQRASALAQRRVCGDAVFLRNTAASTVWLRREALRASATPLPLARVCGAAHAGLPASDREWARDAGEAKATREGADSDSAPTDTSAAALSAARGAAADVIASLDRMSRGAEVRHQMLGFAEDPATGKLVALDELSADAPRAAAADGADALHRNSAVAAAAESMDAAQCYHFVRRHAVAAVAAHVRAVGRVPAHGSHLDTLMHANGVNLALMPLVRDDAASPSALRDVLAVQIATRALACVMWSRAAAHEPAAEGEAGAARADSVAQFCTDALGAWAPAGHVTAASAQVRSSSILPFLLSSSFLLCAHILLFTRIFLCASAQLWSVDVRSELLLGPCGRDGALRLRADEEESPRLICVAVPHWLAAVGPLLRHTRAPLSVAALRRVQAAPASAPPPTFVASDFDSAERVTVECSDDDSELWRLQRALKAFCTTGEAALSVEQSRAHKLRYARLACRVFGDDETATVSREADGTAAADDASAEDARALQRRLQRSVQVSATHVVAAAVLHCALAYTHTSRGDEGCIDSALRDAQMISIAPGYRLTEVALVVDKLLGATEQLPPELAAARALLHALAAAAVASENRDGSGGHRDQLRACVSHLALLDAPLYAQPVALWIAAMLLRDAPGLRARGAEKSEVESAVVEDRTLQRLFANGAAAFTEWAHSAVRLDVWARKNSFAAVAGLPLPLEWVERGTAGVAAHASPQRLHAVEPAADRPATAPAADATAGATVDTTAGGAGATVDCALMFVWGTWVEVCIAASAGSAARRESRSSAASGAAPPADARTPIAWLDTAALASHSLSSSVAIARVACGAAHAALVTDAGQLFVFGRGANGQLGLGDKLSRARPSLVEYFVLHGCTVARAACGSAHTAVATTGGELYTWGCADDGRLGLGPYEPALLHGGNAGGSAQASAQGAEMRDGGARLELGDQSIPTAVAAFDGTGAGVAPGDGCAALDTVVLDVACGAAHTLVVSGAGRVHACGAGGLFQLGNGRPASCWSPVVVDLLRARRGAAQRARERSAAGESAAYFDDDESDSASSEEGVGPHGGAGAASAASMIARNAARRVPRRSESQTQVRSSFLCCSFYSFVCSYIRFLHLADARCSGCRGGGGAHHRRRCCWRGALCGTFGARRCLRVGLLGERRRRHRCKSFARQRRRGGSRAGRRAARCAPSPAARRWTALCSARDRGRTLRHLRNARRRSRGRSVGLRR
jgi:hypothetical protein